jgi:membrane associated rhomboid family serine protease
MFQFYQLPPLVKNIIIINIIFYVATVSLSSIGISLVDYFGLHQIQSSKFYPHQLITHFFMHGSIPHLFFNMFALWMFGKTLENIWGPKRFLTYYFVTAIGAAILHIMVTQLKISNLIDGMDISNVNSVIENGANILQNRQNYINSSMSKLNLLINIPTVGASGAVFGVLLAFGLLFPNTLLYIYFAFPIKAKYFIIIYAIIELYLAIINNPNDNVAHFAHLGGMIFGYILLKYWQKNKTHFY